MSIRTSVHPQKVTSVSMKFGMYDGMQYDPIQRQGQGHEPFKVGNLAIFTAISSAIYNGSWQLNTDF